MSARLTGPDGRTERLRLPVSLLLAVFLVVGAFTRQPHNTLASIVGIGVAVPCCYVGTREGSRLGVPLLLLSAAGVVLNAGGTGAATGHFGLCVLAASAIPCHGPRRGGVVIAAMYGVLLYKFLHDGVQVGWVPWLGGLTISSAGGALYAHELDLLTQLRAAQAGLAERSRVEERTRIARDLHDVIAHSLTVSLLHVTAARLAVEHDERAEAGRALEEAERLGRESLDEVRSIVGLMRHSGPEAEAELAPTPGLDGIADLVGRFRSAGVDIALERDAAVNGGVPATVSTTAYRITQEALTNVAKHAPGASVSVRLRAVDGDWLELCVDSSGPGVGPGGAPRGAGNGLASMRERAEAVGGRLSAGARELDAGQGWRVLAELPTGSGRWRA